MPVIRNPPSVTYSQNTDPPCTTCGKNDQIQLSYTLFTHLCIRCKKAFSTNEPATYAGDLTMFYMVLNNALQSQSPDQSGFWKTINADTPLNKLYFDEDKKELAEKMIEWLASKNQGQRFYLAHIIDAAQTEDPPVKWKNKKT